jgi:hypothetical protein
MNFIFSKLPLDIIKYEILPYDKNFIIRKGEIIAIIPKDDTRYDLLSRIPPKEVSKNGVIFVYLTINDEKDYFIVYKDFEIQIQTLGYDTDNNSVDFIDGHIVPL